MRRLERGRLLRGIVGVEQDVGVQVPVARVEHVARLEAALRAQPAHAGQRFGEAGARHDAVHDVEAARRAAVGAEGRLASLPDRGALRLVARHAHRARALVLRQSRDPLDLRLEAHRRAVDLDEEHRAGVERQPNAEPGFHQTHGVAVHDLHGGGNDAGRDRGRDRATRLLDGLEVEQHGLHGLRLGQEAHADLGDDRERAFAADHRGGEVEMRAVGRLAAEQDDVAVLEHRDHAEHVVEGHAVLEAVRTAGIRGDVAAHGAHLLRGGIGRVVEVVLGQLPRQIQIHHARLDPREHPLGIHAQHAIHAIEREHEPAMLGGRAARQTGARAARGDGHAVRARPAHDGRDLVARARQHDGVGRMLLDDQRVGFVREAGGAAVEHAVVAEERAQRREIEAHGIHTVKVARQSHADVWAPRLAYIFFRGP